KLTNPLPVLVPISKLVVPCNGPVPALRFISTLTLPPKPTVESFPNVSWLLTAGCVANGPPAMPDPGWVAKTNRLATAALMLIEAEVAPIRLPLLKLRVMLVATRCDKLVKVARPALTVMLVLPCKVPLPPKRATETTVVLSLERKLPNESSSRIIGWGAKITPPARAPAAAFCWTFTLWAPAPPTTSLLEVAPPNLPLPKLSVIASATLYDRFVNCPPPPLAVSDVVPCNVPLPVLRLAVTT